MFLVESVVFLDLEAEFFSFYGWLIKKFTAAFRLSQKNIRNIFLCKKSHLTKFTAKCIAKSVSHLSR